MKLYLFDVDATLNISPRLPGPIDIRDVVYLKNQGNAVGIMGDWETAIKNYPDWWKLFCIIAPIEKLGLGSGIAMYKAADLSTLKSKFPHDWEIIMVGNRPGVHPGSNDSGAAALSGIRFISETDFANGKRQVKAYAFDVDETLEVSGGPITLESLADLKKEGHVVGLCGNWALFLHRVKGWEHLISFMGPMSMEKHEFLSQLVYYLPCDEVVMVGNVQGVSGASDDYGAAQRATIRFIKESDFANGER